MQNLTERTLTSKHIFSGRIISVQVDEVELPNGEKGSREIVKHPGAVAIMPFLADGKMLLVRQFRKPLEKVIYEIPAGKLEVGEEPSHCAQRELEEETGFQAANLRLVTSFYTSPGFANELIYIFEAEDLQETEVNLDEDEFLELVPVTLAEAQEMVENKRYMMLRPFLPLCIG